LVFRTLVLTQDQRVCFVHFVMLISIVCGCLVLVSGENPIGDDTSLVQVVNMANATHAKPGVPTIKDKCAPSYAKDCCQDQPKTVASSSQGLGTNAVISVLLAFGFPKSAAKMMRSGLEILKEEGERAVKLEGKSAENFIDFPGVKKEYGDINPWKFWDYGYKGINDLTNLVVDKGTVVVDFSKKNAKTIGWIALCAGGSVMLPGIVVLCIAKLALDVVETAGEVVTDGGALADAAWSWYKCSSHNDCKDDGDKICPKINSESFANKDYMDSKCAGKSIKECAAIADQKDAAKQKF